MSMEEVGRIMYYDNEETNTTRDILLFSCFTGLNLSEIEIIQARDFYTDDEGKRWLDLYNELPLHFEKILINPALAKVVDRNLVQKKKNDMLFAFPSKSNLQKHLWLITKYCELQCELTPLTGEHTCKYNYEYMSKHDLAL